MKYFIYQRLDIISVRIFMFTFTHTHKKHIDGWYELTK